MTAPPPEITPRRRGSADSDEAPDFSVVIRDRDPSAMGEGGPVPVLAPPPKSPMTTAYADSSPRFNPFDKSGFVPGSLPVGEEALPSELTRTDSQVILKFFMGIFVILFVYFMFFFSFVDVWI